MWFVRYSVCVRDGYIRGCRYRVLVGARFKHRRDIPIGDMEVREAIEFYIEALFDPKDRITRISKHGTHRHSPDCVLVEYDKPECIGLCELECTGLKFRNRTCRCSSPRKIRHTDSVKPDWCIQCSRVVL